ncbi:methyltransferase family protein [Gulosibacter molinativorax]|nr:isoprenylcysteine carboxylmethyltransferase family protein [Gulosibacter molinativorax]QUY62512.1 Isoprenylcysteine carboxyl methyltransferase family protein [Gulosibacter molinativorax]
MSVRIPPPVLMVAAGVAQHLLAGKRKPSGASVAGAVVLGGIGAWLDFSALAQFRRHRTTFNPVEVENASDLVTTGPYAVTRNPMYLGAALEMGAYATYRRSATALLPVALFVVLIDRLQIPAEEAALARKFGAKYRKYQSRVPRWVGTASFRPTGKG